MALKTEVHTAAVVIQWVCNSDHTYEHVSSKLHVYHTTVQYGAMKLRLAGYNTATS